MATQAVKVKNEESQGGAGAEFGKKITGTVQDTREFLHDVRVEMRQVTWPTQHEVMVTTFVVIVAVAFFGAFFFGVDSTVGYVLTRIFNIFKH